MKMIGHDHFICHSCIFSDAFSHTSIRQDMTFGRSLMTSSDSVR